MVVTPLVAPDQPVMKSPAWHTRIAGSHELVAAILAGVFLAVGFALVKLADGGGVGSGDGAAEGPGVRLPQSGGEWLVWASLAIGLVYGGRAAWEAIRDLDFNIDVLMVVGAVLAAGLGHPEEGALLLFLFVLSGALEDLAMKRTTSAVTALNRMIPTETLVRRGGQWRAIRPEEAQVGETVLVRPGERVPTDGVVTSGATELNQASLTGESRPRFVGEGDEVFAGTINESHPVEVRVMRLASDSSLQRVLNLVLRAQERRQPVQQLIDRLSTPYSVSVLVVCVISLLVLRFGLERAWSSAAYTAITLLIVASPCALIIATPTATLSSISRAARAGVLFKGGESIERLASFRCAALDKTGTLTMGRPRVEQVHPVAWSDEATLVALAAGLEQGSTHPFAQAIIEEAQRRGIEPVLGEEQSFHPGKGVSGLHDGSEVRLGRFDYVRELMPICLHARLGEVMEALHARGSLAVALAWRDQAGVFVLRDEPRGGGQAMVREFHDLGVRPVVMLTGDVQAVARRMSEHLQLDAFHAQLHPDEKLAFVERLRAEHGRVAVVGDGVNDAPSLAASDAGIAIGGIGSDAALETADVVLMNEDLRAVTWAVRLARSTVRTIVANLTFAIGAIVVLIIGTLLGWVNLPLGVLGHEGGTLLVVANGLRLLLYPSPQGASPVPPREAPPAAMLAAAGDEAVATAGARM